MLLNLGRPVQLRAPRALRPPLSPRNTNQKEKSGTAKPTQPGERLSQQWLFNKLLSVQQSGRLERCKRT